MMINVFYYIYRVVQPSVVKWPIDTFSNSRQSRQKKNNIFIRILFYITQVITL